MPGRNTGLAVEVKQMFLQRMEEAITRIEQQLKLPSEMMYREKVPPANVPYATLWPLSMYQSALITAALQHPQRYLPLLRRLQQPLRAYWDERHATPGFDAYPRGNDKYYDDNAWVALNYLRLYCLTREPEWLRWAERTHQFVWSGWDQQLGGGIYWHQSRKSKNTCSNAPALVTALWLYALTRQSDYLRQAEQLQQWLASTLQDHEDGLYWDHITVDGHIDRTKFPYNTALMIDASLWWYRLTRQEQYLREAIRLSYSAQKRWMHRRLKALQGFAPFVVKMCEAYWHLADVTAQSRWQVIVLRTAEMVVGMRSREDDYPEEWYAHRPKPPETSLMSLASAACLFGIATSIEQGRRDVGTGTI